MPVAVEYIADTAFTREQTSRPIRPEQTVERRGKTPTDKTPLLVCNRHTRGAMTRPTDQSGNNSCALDLVVRMRGSQG